MYYADRTNMTLMENYVRQIVPLIKEDDTTAEFWIRLHNVKIGSEYRFREITTGIIEILCLPFANAEVERVFSATSYYRSWRRSQISLDLLENMLYCKFGILWLGVKLCDFIPPPEMLNFSSSLVYDYVTK